MALSIFGKSPAELAVLEAEEGAAREQLIAARRRSDEQDRVRQALQRRLGDPMNAAPGEDGLSALQRRMLRRDVERADDEALSLQDEALRAERASDAARERRIACERRTRDAEIGKSQQALAVLLEPVIQFIDAQQLALTRDISRGVYPMMKLQDAFPTTVATHGRGWLEAIERQRMQRTA